MTTAGWEVWKQDFEYEQARSDDDGAVGDVEGGPLVRANIEEKEIDDAVADQAVPQIADGAAQDQRQSDACQRSWCRCSPTEALRQ